jgi:thioredoxin 1
MNRRDFVLAATATTLLPAAAWAKTNYKPGLVQAELAAGKTVFLDFTASWCSTCQSQGRTIASLKAANPAYEQAISFIDVDWDQYRGADLTKALRIPRRSTLVVLKGSQELGRIVAGTGRSQIQQLMDVALGAATS